MAKIQSFAVLDSFSWPVAVESILRGTRLYTLKIVQKLRVPESGANPRVWLIIGTPLEQAFCNNYRMYVNVVSMHPLGYLHKVTRRSNKLKL